jgi:hypothetical protein
VATTNKDSSASGPSGPSSLRNPGATNPPLVSGVVSPTEIHVLIWAPSQSALQNLSTAPAAAPSLTNQRQGSLALFIRFFATKDAVIKKHYGHLSNILLYATHCGG